MKKVIPVISLFLVLIVVVGCWFLSTLNQENKSDDYAVQVETLQTQINANNNDILSFQQAIDEKLAIITEKQESTDAETAGEIAALQQEITALQERIEALEAENQRLENEIMKLNIVQAYGETDIIMDNIQDEQHLNPNDYRFLLFAVKNSDNEWSSEIFPMAFVFKEIKMNNTFNIYVNSSITAEARYYVYQIIYHTDENCGVKYVTRLNATYGYVWGVK